jgi:hypothetical protein
VGAPVVGWDVAGGLVGWGSGSGWGELVVGSGSGFGSGSGSGPPSHLQRLDITGLCLQNAKSEHCVQKPSVAPALFGFALQVIVLWQYGAGQVEE